MISNERLQQIATLEPDGTEAPLSRLAWEMATELLASRWKPITDDSLPKVGDEVLRTASWGFHVDSVIRDVRKASNWNHYGWTHYRPIFAPEASK